ncbi:MAG: hypothetical protein ABIH03_08750 [Pseudomonadota bacterium]
MRLIFDCCKGAKEEKRLLDGIGVGAEYTFHLHPPKEIPPPEDAPEPADEERVIN